MKIAHLLLLGALQTLDSPRNIILFIIIELRVIIPKVNFLWVMTERVVLETAKPPRAERREKELAP